MPLWRGTRERVRHFGIPGGYEFGSFLEELIDVGNGTTDLSEKTKAALQGLTRDIHIRVFVTPSCPFCPAAARLAHKMAVESGSVTADVVEASEFPDHDKETVTRTAEELARSFWKVRSDFSFVAPTASLEEASTRRSPATSARSSSATWVTIPPRVVRET